MKMKEKFKDNFKNGDFFYQPGIISSWRDMLDLSWGKVEFQESWRLNSSLSSEWISSITLWWMISDCKKKCYHPSLLLCNDLSYCIMLYEKGAIFVLLKCNLKISKILNILNRLKTSFWFRYKIKKHPKKRV